jgi:hypothetical protein
MNPSEIRSFIPFQFHSDSPDKTKEEIPNGDDRSPSKVGAPSLSALKYGPSQQEHTVAPALIKTAKAAIDAKQKVGTTCNELKIHNERARFELEYYAMTRDHITKELANGATGESVAEKYEINNDDIKKDLHIWGLIQTIFQ